MLKKNEFSGVFTAVVTPFNRNDEIDLDNLGLLIRSQMDDGVNGILLAGTTGEGPMLSLSEIEEIIGYTVDLTRDKDLIIMAGTGCVSIKDTLAITRRAFELGVDAVVTLPPYYLKKITSPGLIAYYDRIMSEAVPDGKHMFVYDIPQITGITMEMGFFEGLLKLQEQKFCGVKDSIGDFAHSQDLIQRFPGLRVMIGTDKLLLKGLQTGAAGSITAGTNVLASYASRVYRAFIQGDLDEAQQLQEKLTAARSVLEKFTPFSIGLKSLLAHRFKTANWELRLPLLPLSLSERESLIQMLKELDLDASFAWL